MSKIDKTAILREAKSLYKLYTKNSSLVGEHVFKPQLLDVLEISEDTDKRITLRVFQNSIFRKEKNLNHEEFKTYLKTLIKLKLDLKKEKPVVDLPKRVLAEEELVELGPVARPLLPSGGISRLRAERATISSE